jgi:glycerol-3-phosphate acyltransferase PlsY
VATWVLLTWEGLLGKKYALLVFLLDLFKGFFPVLLSRFYFGLDSWTTFFVGLFAFLGASVPCLSWL